MTSIGRGKVWASGALGLFFTILAIAGISGSAEAIPSYARQTGFTCAQCHTGLPELTPFGREFKINGYTFSNTTSSLPPVAAMIIPAFTHTEAGQPGVNQHFGPNDNLSVEQVSLFYGGKITDNVGAFAQITYDGVGRVFSWDNLDVRWAQQGTLFGSDVSYGVTLNNNPTMQDVWNTTPAWGFPFVSGALAPAPVAATLVDGGLGQQVLGLGAYAWWNHLVYAEFSGYRTISAWTQSALGVNPSGLSSISGIAPYWRFAIEPSWDKHSWEIGTYGLYASLNPGRVTSAGQDHITDIGFDTQYQYNGERDQIGVQINYIHEYQDLHASATLSGTNGHNHLDTLRIKASYFYEHTYGINISWFNISGTPDAVLWGTNNGSPNSDGWLFEANYIPFSNGGPEFWPWLNVRFGLQYTIYNHFDGGTVNFDGTGRTARNNNTLFLYSMILF